MRTRTLLLAAALTAAGIASSVAQSNVYSINVVGYYNKTIAPGKKEMVGVSLKSDNTTLRTLIKGVPDGTQYFHWTGTGFQGSIYEVDPGPPVVADWGTDFALPLGGGGFLQNNSANPLTITFVGEVVQGLSTNALPGGVGGLIKASIIPQSGALATALQMPQQDGGQVLRWSQTAPVNPGYLLYQNEFDGAVFSWSPSEPTVGVGESFFSRGGVPMNWVRNFTVQ
jgi:hypothetical protein